MVIKHTSQRLFAIVLSVLTVAGGSSAFGQSSSGDSSYYDSEESHHYLVQPARVDLQDQPIEPPETDESGQPSETDSSSFASPSVTPGRQVRIAQVPDMFGDFFGAAAQLFVSQENMPQQFSLASDLPLAGGSRRVKVAENNKAATGDRVYVLYNHFHNALQAQQVGPPAVGTGPFVRSYHVDRYTVGFEKSFFRGLMSAELRLPINGTFRFDSAGQFGAFAANFNVQGGKTGNLAVLLKGQLLATERSVVSLGCGIDLPTGSDVRGQTIFIQPGPGGPVVDDLSLVVNNDALHLLPFLAASHAPTDNLFFHLFVQADMAANSNPVDVSFVRAEPMAMPVVINERIGNYTEQNLLHLDFAVGYWLYQNPYADFVRGLASLLELHYTTAIQDTDNVQTLLPEGPTPLNVQITNLRNRVDVANLTAGVHFDLAWRSSLRVAGVVPVSNTEESRFFDSEIWVSFIKQL